jgi:hypothetical protein
MCLISKVTMPGTLVYGFQKGSGLFSSPHKVYVAYGALSSIYIISSTIYSIQNFIFFTESRLPYINIASYTVRGTPRVFRPDPELGSQINCQEPVTGTFPN